MATIAENLATFAGSIKKIVFGTGNTTISFSETTKFSGLSDIAASNIKTTNIKSSDEVTSIVIEESTGNVSIGTSYSNSKLHIIPGSLTLQGNQTDSWINFVETGWPDRFGIGCDFTGAGSLNRFYISANGANGSPTVDDAQLIINQEGLLKFNSGYGSTQNVYGVRAWANFNGSSNPLAITNSQGVSSLTDVGTGRYRINLSITLPDSNACFLAISERNSTGLNIQTAITTTSFDIRTWNSSQTLTDAETVCTTVIR